MPKESEPQKETIERVMHEFTHGELKSGSGRKVVNPRQAIAIGLSEAGASNEQTPKENRERLARTKRRERMGKTAEQRTEGRAQHSLTTAQPRLSTAAVRAPSESPAASARV